MLSALLWAFAAVSAAGFLVPKLGFLRLPFWTVSLFTLCGTMNIPMFIAWVLVRAFSRRLAVVVNCWFPGFLWWCMQAVAEVFQGMRITVSGDVPEGENSLIISNHLSFCDFYLIHALATRRKMLPNCKYFVKKSLLMIPFFGWGMWMMEMIALSRNWNKDKELVKKSFANVVTYKVPMWLVCFCEGTRQTRKKLEESQAFCKAKGLPVLNRVQWPRTKGFTTSIMALRGSHIKYVYDLTLVYRNPKKPNQTLGFPSIARLHTKSVSHYRFHVHVRRFPIADLPESEEALGKWLCDRWAEKDKIIEQCHAHWPGTPNSEYKANYVPLLGAFSK